MTVLALLEETLAAGASDLHLLVGAPPSIRVHGDIHALAHPPLDAATCRALVEPLLDGERSATLRAEWQVCFSMAPTAADGGRIGHFRVSVHLRDGVPEAAIRVTPQRVRTLEELGLPPVLRDLMMRDTGLVLVTGPTGQGKTTTFNALIDEVNTRQRRKVITIEDPVEYRHRHDRSIIVQLEVGTDTRSFPDALRHALREDPDVICIGEMRDLETISTALTAAETGHLVLATLHTPSAIGTINRIIDVFHPSQQAQVRVQLASTLAGVVSQRLLPRADQRGRVVACEVLLATDAVRNQIREDKVHLMHNVLATGRALGMQRLEDHLRVLLETGRVSRSAAAAAANDVRVIADLL
ncbi:MAG: PilT/PilU family type 4a pilus ATPase [Pseudomonadota bacterium]|nr:PilT/PilU family type 4a pilus ATPase [Pseudomonadota bacterium]